MKSIRILAVVLATVAATANAAPVQTTVGSTSGTSVRMSRALTLAIGYLRDFFSVVAVSAGGMLTDFLRVNGAIGTNGAGLSLGGGLKFVLPGMNLTPAVGL